MKPQESKNTETKDAFVINVVVVHFQPPDLVSSFVASIW
jgi:hypothetical protein